MDTTRHRGKVAIITGAGSGIGAATAVRMAAEGATVVGVDVNAEGLEKVRAQIEEAGGEVTIVTADITDQEAVDRVVQTTLERYGRIDVLANIAGIMDWFLPAHELDDETWRRVMAVNVNGPMLLILLILMGLGPLLAWRETTREALLRAAGIPLAISIVAILVMLWLFGQPMAAMGVGASLFAAGAVVVEYYRGVRLRQKNAGDSIPAAIYQLARRDPRRYGGYIVHLGVVLIAIGIIASWFFQSERQVVISPGETVDLAGYTIAYDGISTAQGADHRTVSAHVRVLQDGDQKAAMEAKRFFYRGFEDQPTTKVAVETVGFDDVYVMLLEWSDDQRANIRIFVNPLVTWIWAGGALYLFGMVVLALPAPVPRPVRATVPQRVGGLVGETAGD